MTQDTVSPTLRAEPVDRLTPEEVEPKDIPALQQVFPQPITAALLKGRGNYICRFKLRDMSFQIGGD